MNNKGFTLIEMVIAAVILVIIIVSSILIANGKINEQRKTAFESTVKMLIKGVDLMTIQNSRLSATELTALDVTAAGGLKAEIIEWNVVSLNPTKVSLKTAKDSKFKGCYINNATINNIVTSGTKDADGVISGC